MNASSISRIAETTVAVLVAQLPAAADQAAPPDVKDAPHLYGLVQHALASKPDAERTLAALAAQPAEKSRQIAVARELEVVMLCDAAFADTLLCSLFAGQDRFVIHPQHVVLEPLDGEGPILDLGGGGEGVMTRLMGERVVAVDASEEELAAAPPGPLKIVMQGHQLLFADDTFETATAFYSLMHIAVPDRPAVLRELFRVIKPGGRLLVWDGTIPRRCDRQDEAFVIPLVLTLPEDELITARGIPWVNHEQDLPTYTALAREAGFELVEQTDHGHAFYLELRKPRGSRADAGGDQG